jgi:uncharacterized protein
LSVLLFSQKVTIAWQGGEPTLMGIDFFKRAITFEKKYAKKNTKILNTLQTNGTLLNDEWCELFHKNNFLIGISIDGPKHLHNAYRRDKKGNPVYEKVISAIRLMQKHKVEFNILCTVNNVNGASPLEVYRFFRDELKTQYLQFIPIVERDNESGNQEGFKITKRSVRAEQYGKFLNAIFDEWVKRDVGSMFVQLFDGVLASFVRGYSTLCVLRPYCGDSVALEHNGDLYSCDHYVEPKNLLGKTPLIELISSTKQHTFAKAKAENLPSCCQRCEYLFTCYGECPKNRVLTTAMGEKNLNWLCSGLKAFFAHTQPKMKKMAQLLKQGKSAVEIMKMDTN